MFFGEEVPIHHNPGKSDMMLLNNEQLIIDNIKDALVMFMKYKEDMYIYEDMLSLIYAKFKP